MCTYIDLFLAFVTIFHSIAVVIVVVDAVHPLVPHSTTPDFLFVWLFFFLLPLFSYSNFAYQVSYICCSDCCCCRCCYFAFVCPLFSMLTFVCSSIFIVSFTPMDDVFGRAEDRAITFKWWIQAIKYISIYIHKQYFIAIF